MIRNIYIAFLNSSLTVSASIKANYNSLCKVGRVCPEVLASCGAWIVYEKQAPCEIGVFEQFIVIQLILMSICTHVLGYYKVGLLAAVDKQIKICNDLTDLLGLVQYSVNQSTVLTYFYKFTLSYITNVLTTTMNLAKYRFKHNCMVNINLSHQKYLTYHKLRYASKKMGTLHKYSSQYKKQNTFRLVLGQITHTTVAQLTCAKTIFKNRTHNTASKPPL